MHPIIANIFAPTPPVLIISTLIVLLVPILIHHFIFRARPGSSPPTFILLGPSGSGKTSLAIYLEKGRSTPTQTSQTPLLVKCTILSSKTHSGKYRSANDPSAMGTTIFQVLDTPGHAKLRDIVYHEISNSSRNIKGLIFVVDSAEELTTAAEYLHDVLLYLQKKGGQVGGTSSTKGVKVLIACNKNDLFTALPAGRITGILEKEITNIRESRAKGLLNSAVDNIDSLAVGDEDDWLGEGGEGEFKLEMMEDLGVSVSVKGGSVDKGECETWLEWIGECL